MLAQHHANEELLPPWSSTALARRRAGTALQYYFEAASWCWRSVGAALSWRSVELAQHCSVALAHFAVPHWCSFPMAQRRFCVGAVSCSRNFAASRCYSVAAALHYCILGLAVLRWGSVAASHWHIIPWVRHRIGTSLHWNSVAFAQHCGIALAKRRIGAVHGMGWRSISELRYAPFVSHWCGMAVSR